MSRNTEEQNVSLEIIRVIRELQQGSGYGSIEITLHDGRVTLIEKREKLRFIKDSKEITKQSAHTALNEHNTVAARKIN